MYYSTVTDEEILELLYMLHERARVEDPYGFGLPLYDHHTKDLINIVRRFLKCE